MDKSVWLTQSEMREICPSCAEQMAAQRISKLKIVNAEGEFVFTKAGFSQGMCDKFGDPTGFRTRCMESMSGKVDDEGAFCNSLKIYCHGSAGAENKRAGKIIAKNDKRRYTLGIVYEPDSLDTDNEFTDAAELEKACWDFMRNLQGSGEVAKAAVGMLSEIKKAIDNGDELELEIGEEFDELMKRGVNAMHTEDLEDCDVVECYIAPADMVIGDQSVKKGTWLAGIIWNDECFKKIQTGEWAGYSMGGHAHKVEA